MPPQAFELRMKPCARRCSAVRTKLFLNIQRKPRLAFTWGEALLASTPRNAYGRSASQLNTYSASTPNRVTEFCCQPMSGVRDLPSIAGRCSATLVCPDTVRRPSRCRRSCNRYLDEMPISLPPHNSIDHIQQTVAPELVTPLRTTLPSKPAVVIKPKGARGLRRILNFLK